MKHNTLFSVDRTCASKFYSMPCYTAIHYLLKEIQKTLTQRQQKRKTHNHAHLANTSVHFGFWQFQSNDSHFNSWMIRNEQRCQTKQSFSETGVIIPSQRPKTTQLCQNICTFFSLHIRGIHGYSMTVKYGVSGRGQAITIARLEYPSRERMTHQLMRETWHFILVVNNWLHQETTNGIL